MQPTMSDGSSDQAPPRVHTVPCLVADELSDRANGSLGLWVGEGSGGHFANLKVTRKPRNAEHLTSPALHGRAATTLDRLRVSRSR
jgi:hypothetical protein